MFQSGGRDRQERPEFPDRAGQNASSRLVYADAKGGLTAKTAGAKKVDDMKMPAAHYHAEGQAMRVLRRMQDKVSQKTDKTGSQR